GNSGIHIFCRRIFRQIQASILLILVSDPWPGYTFAEAGGGICGINLILDLSLVSFFLLLCSSSSI
ncbi:hypothetical protein ACN38_g4997, partial [Penicillium nordicum]